MEFAENQMYSQSETCELRMAAGSSIFMNHKTIMPMAKKVTSKEVAKKASQALRDGRSSKRTKSIAGSALSQREKKK